MEIDSSLYLSSMQKDQRKTGDILGKDDFLKILMVQLQNQDPLNPMQDKDFIAQMATFSSLEQMTNMNSSLQKFLTGQGSDALLNYSGLIGKQVAYTVPATDESADSLEGAGTVKSITRKGSDVQLELTDGTMISSSQLSKISSQENK
ncbi:flagellar hook assembly protein FlgD [Metabacillus sp. GX 13764]|uniref:flagellar hook assembly protein FlgD n=1 Tax=Metabacillus kandeliae TaxID=2900151 RepID=UPI001E4DF9F0|nr:flagellar hook assembly protein FlgD [Metabacillus kandeliae]MCD7033777.1 flagellar hook assembly protein FlgD [Metabacillus kandeliae]